MFRRNVGHSKWRICIEEPCTHILFYVFQPCQDVVTIPACFKPSVSISRPIGRHLTKRLSILFRSRRRHCGSLSNERLLGVSSSSLSGRTRSSRGLKCVFSSSITSDCTLSTLDQEYVWCIFISSRSDLRAQSRCLRDFKLQAAAMSSTRMNVHCIHVHIDHHDFVRDACAVGDTSLITGVLCCRPGSSAASASSVRVCHIYNMPRWPHLRAQ